MRTIKEIIFIVNLYRYDNDDKIYNIFHDILDLLLNRR